MLEPINRRSHFVAWVILIFAAFAAAVCCYILIKKGDNRIPAKGIFVQSFKADSSGYLH